MNNDRVAKDPCSTAHQEIWRRRIQSELASVKEWGLNWGFLVEDSTCEPQSPLPQTVARPELQQTFKESSSIREARIVCLEYLYFITIQRLNFLGPKEKYTQPVTSSQTIGWHRPVELFGVCQYGKRKRSNLMPHS